MTVWPGLGLNYKSRDTDVIAEDIRYFRKIGLRYIRVHIPAFKSGQTWNSTSYALWRVIARRFTEAGFTVLFGISWVNPNDAEWQNWADHVVAEAKYCADNGICAEFNIGNELELHLVDITEADFVTRTKQLATAVKAAAPGIKIVYSFGAFGNHGNFWISAGKGDIDYLAGNVYGNYFPARGYYNRLNYRTVIPQMQAAFGSGWYISEFNVEAVSATFNGMPEDLREDELTEMHRFISKSGVSRAYLYQYRAYDGIDGNDSFYMRYNDGTFRRAWNAIESNNGRRVYLKRGETVI
ncbi:hypothetical protein ACWFRF_15485 [Nocardia sp. NPDC055165]